MRAALMPKAVLMIEQAVRDRDMAGILLALKHFADNEYVQEVGMLACSRLSPR